MSIWSFCDVCLSNQQRILQQAPPTTTGLKESKISLHHIGERILVRLGPHYQPTKKQTHTHFSLLSLSHFNHLSHPLIVSPLPLPLFLSLCVYVCDLYV